MQSYHDLIYDILRNGTPHEDRTGTGTLSVFGRQWRHNFKDGFPLINTKFVPLRVVFEELMWFLSGSTNRRDLTRYNVKIWDEWTAPNPSYPDDMGPIYGRQFRAFGCYTDKLKIVECKTPSYESCFYTPPFEIVTHLEWKVLETSVSKDADGRPFDLVQCGSGYQYAVRRDQHQRNSVRDPYMRSVAGVGYAGEPIEDCEDKKILYKVWVHMLERCYKPSCKEYKSYGAMGVSVCAAWHDFSVFYRQAQTLVGWCHKREEPSIFELDKDHFRSNCYSAETCVWLPGWMNKKYRFRRPFIATSETGETHYHISVASFAKTHDLSTRNINQCLDGTKKSHKGWRFEKCDDNGYGFTLPFDQIAWLLREIARNPNSRRLIVTAWQPNQVEDMALPPCHYGFQVKCYPDTSEMSLHMTMRSCDVFLGLPFNIASYAMLLEMLCYITGYKPKELIISFGDLHLYNNHYDQATDQLSRLPYPLPTVQIDEAYSNPGTGLDRLLNLTWEDIVLHNYKHHPKISAPVAI